jgi:lupus La protein
MKARAAVEFVGGLVVKNNFSVALEAINGEMERELWKRLSSAELEGGYDIKPNLVYSSL